ncbi:hypothetical protein BCR41DRAFT_368782 [Lobosporangium transversale]|uniref:Uncharacterized protein n=1 Tax=Lobosporangium transversale TaxID=64571 RepID=A0A1Y2GV56_9FUNG|nr:hypothetical protein BCR41DRAFT_368782 [Lobosporangium transversale]ORZ24980.1 hypothetical protein BCR41DRAFT_368782 [Lobosporangium transversale]|eukprot:XP_021883961.1 hypothetical protein BCR41DRAFT_368782 [Lobosporangium transversale]
MGACRNSEAGDIMHVSIIPIISNGVSNSCSHFHPSNGLSLLLYIIVNAIVIVNVVNYCYWYPNATLFSMSQVQFVTVESTIQLSNKPYKMQRARGLGKSPSSQMHYINRLVTHNSPLIRGYICIIEDISQFSIYTFASLKHKY